MRPYQIATLTVVLVASVLGVPPHAYPGQTAQPPTQPDFRGAVDLVEVSVIVTEADGSPVRALAIDDFEVSEDGDLQPVLTFAHVDIPRDAFDEPGSRPRSGVTSNTRGDARAGCIYCCSTTSTPTRFGRTRFGPSDVSSWRTTSWPMIWRPSPRQAGSRRDCR